MPKNNLQRGFVETVALLITAFLLATIPVAVKVAQENQDIRNYAAEPDCSVDNKCIRTDDPSQCYKWAGSGCDWSGPLQPEQGECYCKLSKTKESQDEQQQQTSFSATTCSRLNDSWCENGTERKYCNNLGQLEPIAQTWFEGAECKACVDNRAQTITDPVRCGGETVKQHTDECGGRPNGASWCEGENRYLCQQDHAGNLVKTPLSNTWQKDNEWRKCSDDGAVPCPECQTSNTSPQTTENQPKNIYICQEYEDGKYHARYYDNNGNISSDKLCNHGCKNDRECNPAPTTQCSWDTVGPYYIPLSDGSRIYCDSDTKITEQQYNNLMHNLNIVNTSGKCEEITCGSATDNPASETKPLLRRIVDGKTVSYHDINDKKCENSEDISSLCPQTVGVQEITPPGNSVPSSQNIIRWECRDNILRQYTNEKYLGVWKKCGENGCTYGQSKCNPDPVEPDENPDSVVTDQNNMYNPPSNTRNYIPDPEDYTDSVPTEKTVITAPVPAPMSLFTTLATFNSPLQQITSAVQNLNVMSLLSTAVQNAIDILYPPNPKPTTNSIGPRPE